MSWDLAAIQLPALETRVGAPAVTVAILDTGLSAQPQLNGVQRSGYDFISDPRTAGDGGGRDPQAWASRGGVGYHGTAVAGLVHQVNPSARLLHVRIIGRADTATLADALDGLRWAAGLPVPGVPANPFPARVINASFKLKDVPYTGCAPAMQRAVDEVIAHGSVIVAAAGNSRAAAARYTPGGCRGVITVAATGTQGRRAPYSNWGAAVALAAPGGTATERIDVLLPGGGEAERTGTSFAAPLVAGAASLLVAEHPGLRPTEVSAILRHSARPFAGGQCDQLRARSCGAGVLDVRAALGLASGWAAATRPEHGRPLPARPDARGRFDPQGPGSS
ncbi:S8 family serine peptidase [Deinococcus rufus]|uniref:S8 family serine peptidase n=1 Tax=Deinococcus rufus TaxID=2136097 RepID=A0ABV7Z9F4_9DEIO